MWKLGNISKRGFIKNVLGEISGVGNKETKKVIPDVCRTQQLSERGGKGLGPPSSSRARDRYSKSVGTHTHTLTHTDTETHSHGVGEVRWLLARSLDDGGVKMAAARGRVGYDKAML